MKPARGGGSGRGSEKSEFLIQFVATRSGNFSHSCDLMQIFIYRINFTFIQPHTELSSDLLPAARQPARERIFIAPAALRALSSLDLKISFFRLPQPKRRANTTTSRRKYLHPPTFILKLNVTELLGWARRERFLIKNAPLQIQLPKML
jgi:hypothetical protein